MAASRKTKRIFFSIKSTKKASQLWIARKLIFNVLRFDRARGKIKLVTVIVNFGEHCCRENEFISRSYVQYAHKSYRLRVYGRFIGRNVSSKNARISNEESAAFSEITSWRFVSCPEDENA